MEIKQGKEGEENMWNQKKYSSQVRADEYVDFNFSDVWNELKKIKIAIVIIATIAIFKKLLKR